MLELAQDALIYLRNNLIEIIGIILTSIITYHIYFLSKKISNSERLKQKEILKEKTLTLLSEIHRNGLRSKVYLVNINRYFKDYPANKEKMGSGYSHIHAELKAVRYNGIEFFCSMPEQAYLTKDGNLTLNSRGNKKAFLVYPVGLVPYEWIDYIDPDGDEYAYVPLFYCRFKGKIYWKSWWRKLLPFGYPYKELYYYRESEVYHEGSDPKDMKWSMVQIQR